MTQRVDRAIQDAASKLKQPLSGRVATPFGAYIPSTHKGTI